MELTIQERIEHVLVEAIELAQVGRNSHVAARVIAERVYESESELMRELTPSVMVKWLTGHIIQMRRIAVEKVYPNFQMVLPDPIFRDLPTSIFLRNGRRKRMYSCTLAENVDHLKLLRERATERDQRKIVRQEAVVTLHAKWNKIEAGITWGEAVRREAGQSG